MRDINVAEIYKTGKGSVGGVLDSHDQWIPPGERRGLLLLSRQTNLLATIGALMSGSAALPLVSDSILLYSEVGTCARQTSVHHNSYHNRPTLLNPNKYYIFIKNID